MTFLWIQQNNFKLNLYSSEDSLSHIIKIIYQYYIYSNIYYTVLYRLTALHWGSIRGHVDVVQALIDAGAEVDALDDKNCTALIFASLIGHLSAVKTLVAHNATVNHSDKNG